MLRGADRPRTEGLVVGLVVVVALIQAGCGGSGGASSTASSAKGERSPAAADGRVTSTGPGDGANESSRAKGASGGGDPYSEGAGGSDAALVKSVRAYVSAIDRGDGRAVCELLVPGALRGVRLPHPGGGCAASVEASIGFHPAGEAAWQGTRIRRIGPVELDPRSPAAARVRATVIHRYNRHREPSIEDDLIYLSHRAGRWMVAKPSSTFYRAIGARDVPLSAITPP